MTLRHLEIQSAQIGSSVGEKPGLDAPQLEDLRTSYGLSSKLKGHDFHITNGYQLPAVKGT